MELVKQTEINIDYILELVSKYHASNCTDKSILVDVNRAIRSNPELYSKKELIEIFVELVNVGENTRGYWKDFVEEQKRRDLEKLINAYNLNAEETNKFVNSALLNGELKLSGEGINKLMPKISRFNKNNDNYSEKKKEICQRLQEIFDKYYDVI